MNKVSLHYGLILYTSIELVLLYFNPYLTFNGTELSFFGRVGFEQTGFRFAFFLSL